MSFTNQNFSVMAYANGFTLWNYSTDDALADVKAINYFNDIATFAREGDMILVAANKAVAVAGSILIITKIEGGVVTVAALS